MIRGGVLVVSKNSFLRRGLAHALAKDSLSLVGEACSLEAALATLESSAQQVDVIIFDADTAGCMVDMKTISEQHPRTHVVIIAANISAVPRDQAAEVKAMALLPNSLSPEALNLALQLVILGEDLILATGPTFEHVKPVGPSLAAGEGVARLSPREAEVLQFIKDGASNKVIARKLDLAEPTVKVHVKSLLRKLEVENRTQAAIWAMQYSGTGGPRAA